MLIGLSRSFDGDEKYAEWAIQKFQSLDPVYNDVKLERIVDSQVKITARHTIYSYTMDVSSSAFAKIETMTLKAFVSLDDETSITLGIKEIPPVRIEAVEASQARNMESIRQHRENIFKSYEMD